MPEQCWLSWVGLFENLLNSVDILHTVPLYACEDHVTQGGRSCEDHVTQGGQPCEDHVTQGGRSCEDHVTQGGRSCEDHVTQGGRPCEDHVIFGDGRAVVGGHVSGCVLWRRGYKTGSKQQADCVSCRVVSGCCMGVHRKKEDPERERKWQEKGTVGVILKCGTVFLH